MTGRQFFAHMLLEEIRLFRMRRSLARWLTIKNLGELMQEATGA